MFTILHYAFAAIVVLLGIASITTAVLIWKHPDRNYIELKLRIQTWWWLVGILFLALAFNHTLAVVAMGLASFMAFKEFLSLAPMRSEDHSVLVFAYLAIPLQYLWAGIAWYGMFIIFIPVYVFLLLPLRMVIVGETKGYLQAAGTIQWGLMTTVFSLSHMAYLLAFPSKDGPHGIITG